MNTALIISLLAVGIALMTIFIALNAAKTAKRKTDGGDGGGYSGNSSSSDCGSVGGGCD